MRFIENILGPDFIQATGWALLSSLWYSGIIALILVVYILLKPKGDARVRYLVFLSSMMLVFVLTGFTFYTTHFEYGAEFETMIPHSVEQSLVPRGATEVSSEDKMSIFNTMSYFDRHLPLFVVFWLLGVTMLIIRFLAGIAYIQRLKKYKVQTVSADWELRLEAMKERLGLSKSVRLSASSFVKTPITVGHLKPLILLPLGIFTGMPTEQLEAILAHELAHIHRRDYLFNMIQNMLDILFFFNPMMYWMSAMVRKERENCCDDMAVGLLGDNLSFAKALVSVQELKVSPAKGYALAFGAKKKHLLNRVSRLLNDSVKVDQSSEKLSAACVLIVVGALTLSVNSQANVKKNHTLSTDTDRLEVLDTTIVNSQDMQNRTMIQTKYQGKKVKLEKQNGQLEALYIDGRQIEKKNFSDHEALVRAVEEKSKNEEVPAPPAPLDYDDLDDDEVQGIPAPSSPKKFEDKGVGRILEELLRNGIIKEGDAVKIELSATSFKVNGTEQATSIAGKYRKIYEEEQGEKLTGNAMVTYRY